MTFIYQNPNLNKPTKLFNHLIRCPHCNKYFNHKSRTTNGTKRNLWLCRDYIDYGKKACPNKILREDILIKTTYDVLLQRNLIKKNTPLTNELLHLHIRQIIANPNQTLEYHLHTGENVVATWEHESRSKSWTPEMRQKARERILKQMNRREG